MVKMFNEKWQPRGKKQSWEKAKTPQAIAKRNRQMMMYAAGGGAALLAILLFLLFKRRKKGKRSFAVKKFFWKYKSKI